MPEGPAKGETRAAEFAFVTHHRTAHGLRNRVDDGQPESAAAGGPVAAGIETNKRFKNLLTGVRWNAGAIVFDDQHRLITLKQQTGVNRRLAVAQGVVE